MNTTRVEKYMNAVISRPGEWIHIRKRKRNKTTAANTAERKEVVDSIVLALQLVGIECEVFNRYWIRTKKEEKEEVVPVKPPMPFQTSLTNLFGKRDAVFINNITA